MTRGGGGWLWLVMAPNDPPPPGPEATSWRGGGGGDHVSPQGGPRWSREVCLFGFPALRALAQEDDYGEDEHHESRRRWHLQCVSEGNALVYTQDTRHGGPMPDHKSAIALFINGHEALRLEVAAEVPPNEADLRLLQEALKAHYRYAGSLSRRVLSRVLGVVLQDPGFAEGLPWALELTHRGV